MDINNILKTDPIRYFKYLRRLEPFTILFPTEAELKRSYGKTLLAATVESFKDYRKNAGHMKFEYTDAASFIKTIDNLLESGFIPTKEEYDARMAATSLKDKFPQFFSNKPAKSTV